LENYPSERKDLAFGDRDNLISQGGMGGMHDEERLAALQEGTAARRRYHDFISEPT